MKFQLNDLTLDQANLIITGLRKLPVEAVETFLGQVVQNFKQQAQEQQKKPEPEPEVAG